MYKTKPMSFLLAATILTSVATAASAATYVRGNDGGDPETLDHHKTSMVHENRILIDLYEGLVVSGADGLTIPGVAETWDISEDGLIYTFHLRQDAKWSNSDPVTAHDFVYAYNRIMDPATTAKYATILYPIKNAETINTGGEAELGVKALDDYTFEVTLESPTPFFIDLLTHQTGLPMHKASVEEFGNDFVKPGNMVSNGAYTLTAFEANEKIVLTKNPEFHDAANVAIDEVHYLPFEDVATCVRRYEAGEVHSCATFPSDMQEDLITRLGDQVHINPYLGTYYYAFNTGNEKLSDVRVRKALSMSIDREFIAKEVLLDVFPATGFVPTGISNYVENPPTMGYEDKSAIDLEDEALKLLEEAGFGPDHPLEIEIAYNSGDGHKKIATAIADMWAGIGVKTTYNVRDGAAHYAMLRDEKSHEVARAGWIADYSDPQNFLFLNETKNPGFNYGNYSNPEFDTLMEDAAKMTDIKARAEILAKAEQIILDDLPLLPIYFYSSHNLVSPKLKGFVDNVEDDHPTRFMSMVE